MSGTRQEAARLQVDRRMQAGAPPRRARRKLEQESARTGPRPQRQTLSHRPVMPALAVDVARVRGRREDSGSRARRRQCSATLNEFRAERFGWCGNSARRLRPRRAKPASLGADPAGVGRTRAAAPAAPRRPEHGQAREPLIGERGAARGAASRLRDAPRGDAGPLDDRGSGAEGGRASPQDAACPAERPPPGGEGATRGDRDDRDAVADSRVGDRAPDSVRGALHERSPAQRDSARSRRTRPRTVSGQSE